jgi:hypothetical protein
MGRFALVWGGHPISCLVWCRLDKKSIQSGTPMHAPAQVDSDLLLPSAATVFQKSGRKQTFPFKNSVFLGMLVAWVSLLGCAHTIREGGAHSACNQQNIFVGFINPPSLMDSTCNCAVFLGFGGRCTTVPSWSSLMHTLFLCFLSHDIFDGVPPFGHLLPLNLTE